jgi:aspartyl-tRNA synthetase
VRLLSLPRLLSREVASHSGEDVRVAGHLQDYRAMGALGFAVIRDRQGLLQVTLKKGTTPPELFELFGGLSRESVVTVEGKVVENPKAKVGAEVMALRATVLSRAETPLPLGVVDKVGAELDTRLNHRVMDLRKKDVQDVMELRDALLDGLRTTFRGMGFVEVETPKILRQGAEGGATLFTIDYFGEKAYLAQSPQLYKQMLMATDMERVFEIAPAFRAEPSDTVRHITEFTSVDAEMAYIAGPEDLWDTVERMLSGTLEFASKELEKRGNPLAKMIPAVNVPFPRIPFEKAMEMLGHAPESDLAGDDEKVLGEIVAKELKNDFYFITEFPSALKRSTFYAMRQDANPEKTQYFDLDFRGLELISGGQREHRLDRLMSQIDAAGLSPSNFPSYLEAFRFGMPPHGGFAMGLDRLTWKLAGLSNVREARLFPRDRFRLEP